MDCNTDATVTLKIAGVWPQGVNHLHDAIDEVNSSFPVFGDNSRKRVRLLKSNFTDESGGGSYVIEIQIPVQTRGDKYGSDLDVPLEVVAQLFSAIGIFLPSA